MTTRKCLQFAVAALALFMLAGLTTTAGAAPLPKVDICHIPPGNPENFHTITVSENALAAHLAHGDLGGACNAVCAALCDDGDACTIDDTADCESDGCPAAPRDPTDCNDSALCTTDSCDSITGCANEPVTCAAPNLCTISACAPDTGECVPSPVSCPDGFACDLDSGDCVPDAPPNLCPCWDTDELLNVTAANNLTGNSCSSRLDVDALIQNIPGSTPGVEGGFAADTGGFSGSPRCDTRDPLVTLTISLEDAEACIAEVKQRCADIGDPIPASLTESLGESSAGEDAGNLWRLE